MIIEATADGRKVMIETDRIQYIANNDGKADVKGDDFVLRFDSYEEIRRQMLGEQIQKKSIPRKGKIWQD